MPARHAKTRLTFLEVALAAFLATAASAAAQTDIVPPGIFRTAPPESMLLRIRVDGAAGPAGWILSHRNRLSGAETPDHEIRSRTVERASETADPGRIAWEITRTRNDRCPARRDTPCPDFIRILRVPDGFIAVPQEAWVGEGEMLRIYIVPAGMV